MKPRRCLASTVGVLVLVPIIPQMARAQITDLGVASGRQFATETQLVAFSVPESAERRDLNDDGDTRDWVVHVHDALTGLTTNLRLAAGISESTFGLDSFAISGSIVAFRVSESAQGGTDLDGDGDVLDSVMHVHDATTGITTNLKLSARHFVSRIAGDLLGFAVVETDQGMADLNGDGDAVDAVVHVYDSRSGRVRNLALSIDPDREDPLGLSGILIAFPVSESNQGSTDLNGDGDTTDFVVHIYDPGTETTINLSLATRSGVQVSDDLVAFSAEEIVNGDLNGDGDTSDSFLHIYRGSSGGINVEVVTLGNFVVSPDLVAFAAFEQVGRDLNNDGDPNDVVLGIHRPSSGITRNLGLALAKINRFRPYLEQENVDGLRVAFAVTEYGQGMTDLNGDGDFLDAVVHLYDTKLDLLTNLALSLGSAFSCHKCIPESQLVVRGDLVAFPVWESEQGRSDLNGDGDCDDLVPHVHDVASGVTTVLKLALDPENGLEDVGLQLHGSSVSLLVSERDHGMADLNGDGDVQDSVVHLHDTVSGLTINLGLAARDFQASASLVAIPVSESDQGFSDLNGDGDPFDEVSHVVQPCGVGTVNTGGGGPVRDVFRINGQTARVAVAPGASISMTLETAPRGPESARYLLWLWRGLPRNQQVLSAADSAVGCLVNPSPLHPGESPQPKLCLHGVGVPPSRCIGVRKPSAPSLAPWILTRSQGLIQPAVFSLQGVIEDFGASNPIGFSLTNAVTLVIQ